MITTTRNATLVDLQHMLVDQQMRKVDVVASASQIRFNQGVMHITGVDVQLDEDGVTQTDGIYIPTEVCDGGIANKLDIPPTYLRRLREQRLDMYDGNINGWLHGSRKTRRLTKPEGQPLESTWDQQYPGISRSFLVRCFKGDDGQPGVARAFLSDRFELGLDNLDVLMAVLAGVKEAGVQVNIVGADLSEKKMIVRIEAPEVMAYAPALLRGYRSPFADTGPHAADDTVVFAGFKILNSEVGHSAFSIVPELRVRVCKNGLTITKDAIRNVHLGGRLDAGIVNWSEGTQQANVNLIIEQTKDAVATFLDIGYMERVIGGIEEKAGMELDSPDQVKVLTKGLSFSQEQMDLIMGDFIRGGQMTLGGVVNAITSAAQRVDDADAAHDMESKALGVLEAAYLT